MEGSRATRRLIPRIAGKPLNLALDQPANSNSSPPVAHNLLHAPLLLRLPAGRLALKLLPFPSRFVILAVNHVTINFLRRPYRPMPQTRGHRRQWYTAGQQVRAVRVSQRVEARALRQLESSE